MFSFVSFSLGVYITGAVFVFLLGSGDPEGRFKYRWMFLWPIYLKSLFGRD